MDLFSLKRSQSESQLSAYLDGELAPGAAAALGERLAFEPQLRETLRAYERSIALVRAALAPEHRPDPIAVAERLVYRVQQLPAPVTLRPVRRPPLLRPAVLASIGILVTAGIALVGLRRRGLI